MNTKLDVVRLANEDVIATSAEFCTDHRDHVFATKLGDTIDNDNDGYRYEYEDGEWTRYYDVPAANQKKGVVTTGAYYVETSKDHYELCDKEHNPNAITKVLDGDI